MESFFVQFSDSSHSEIVNIFCCEQDPVACPDQGQVEEDDARYLVFRNQRKSYSGTSPIAVQAIAEERYKREASGVTVGDFQIETTRDSQALIASTGLSSVLDPEYRCNFKTVTGFVEISAPQIIEIAKAVRAHVQACFDREKALLELVDSGLYREEMLAEGWPDSSRPDSASLK